jgi:hypothetical protein
LQAARNAVKGFAYLGGLRVSFETTSLGQS